MEKLNLRELVERVVKLLRLNAEKKGIGLELKVADDVPEWVNGDSVRLRQVLTNLTQNAIKFTSEGSVTLELSLHSRADDAARVEIGVTDTGPGIPPEKQAKIFGAFTQADNSTTRKFGGTGLGLSISSSLVEMMGGRIRLRSRMGLGSTFKISLPFECVNRGTMGDVSSAEAGGNAQRESTLDKSESQAIELPSARVLLVEDNPVNQKLGQLLLKKLGMEVTLANDGREGVDAYFSQDFDLVLMDWQMPVMDGLEATKEIRARGGGDSRQVPIIALTANAMEGDRKRCLEAGMDDYLSKPILERQLREKLATWLQPA
jgi:CheY-like chemotaxis protein/two-component sensor histidine kinase